MKWRLLLTLVLPLCFVTLTLADDKADVSDLEKGTWKVMSISQGGKDAPAELIAQAKLSFAFKGDKLTVTSAGETKEGSFKLDSTKSPKEIDLSMEKEADKAIYELTKDTLKLAVGKPDRPKEFKSGEKVIVFTLERQK